MIRNFYAVTETVHTHTHTHMHVHTCPHTPLLIHVPHMLRAYTHTHTHTHTHVVYMKYTGQMYIPICPQMSQGFGLLGLNSSRTIVKLGSCVASPNIIKSASAPHRQCWVLGSWSGCPEK